MELADVRLSNNGELRELAVGESSVILLHPPVLVVGVSTGIKQGVSSKMTFSPTARWELEAAVEDFLMKGEDRSGG